MGAQVTMTKELADCYRWAVCKVAQYTGRPCPITGWIDRPRYFTPRQFAHALRRCGALPHGPGVNYNLQDSVATSVLGALPYVTKVREYRGRAYWQLRY